MLNDGATVRVKDHIEVVPCTADPRPGVRNTPGVPAAGRIGKVERTSRRYGFQTCYVTLEPHPNDHGDGKWAFDSTDLEVYAPAMIPPAFSSGTGPLAVATPVVESAQELVLPDLEGLPVEEAERVLTGLGMEPTVRRGRRPHVDIRRGQFGLVEKQTPPCGAAMRRGQPVTLYTFDAEVEEFEPDHYSMSERPPASSVDDATASLEMAGATP